MSANLLPQQFKDLEAFAAKWALATEPERVKKRCSSSIEEIKSFYDAMFPRLEAVIEHLNQFSLNELPETEKRLLYLAFSFAEISLSVEVFGEPGVPYGYDPTRYSCTVDGNPSLPYGHASAKSTPVAIRAQDRR